jgi:hypothetical protein
MAKAAERRTEFPRIQLDERTREVIEEIKRKREEPDDELIALLESWRHEDTGITDEEWIEFRRSIHRNHGGDGQIFGDV